MDKISELMFNLINNVVFNKPVNEDKFKDISYEDYTRLYNISKKHDLAHLVAYGLEKNNLIDKQSDIFKTFQKQMFLAIYRYERIQAEADNIIDCFEKAEIPFIPLKGTALRNFYPEPWMRTSCDIDILVHEEDLERACKVLVEQLNYERGERYHHDISMVSPTGVHFELHFTLIGETTSKESAEVLGEVWDNTVDCEGFKYKKYMINEMFCFFHLSHMLKHFINGGCGIRTFLDLAIIEKGIPVDEATFADLLHKGKLEKFNEKVVKLVRIWRCEAEPDEFDVKFSKYILDGGIYGSNRNSISSNTLRSGGKFKYAMSKIFVPYSILQQRYPIIKKHKWMTPFCEVGRWFRLIFCDRMRKSVKDFNEIKNVSDEEIKNTSEIFKELGIEMKK